MRNYFHIYVLGIMLIGEKIKEVYEGSGMKLSDFADKIGTVRQNIYRIFEKEQIDAGLLVKISEVLKHNFFQYFPVSGIPQDATFSKTVERESIQLELDAAKKEIEHLLQIVSLREDERQLLEAKLKTNKDLTDAIIKHLREKEATYLAHIRQLETDSKK